MITDGDSLREELGADSAPPRPIDVDRVADRMARPARVWRGCGCAG